MLYMYTPWYELTNERQDTTKEQTLKGTRGQIRRASQAIGKIANRRSCYSPTVLLPTVGTVLLAVLEYY